MKRIVFYKSILLFILLSATTLIAFSKYMPLPEQQKPYSAPKENYSSSWKEIEKYEKAGKPKSALKIAEDIYDKAKAAKNAPQQVKAAMHILKFRQQFEEDAMQKGIKWLEEETDKSTFPAKPIMQSILASYYWSYYEEERYEILDRSRISDGEEKELKVEEIESWDADLFSKKVAKLYLASLAEAESLQQIPVREFEDILIKEKESPKYRPTLYDLLAHRAADFFRNTESGITKPIEEWKLDEKTAFLPADEFVKTELKIIENAEPEFKFLTLHIYQSLIRFHLKDKTPDALVDADLQRLKFAKEIIFTEAENHLYYNALLNLEKKFSDNAVTAEVAYERANFFYNDDYWPNKKDTSISQEKLDLNICEETIKKFPKSRGAQNCEALKSQILAKSIGFKMEDAILPNEPFKILINYKNINKVFYKIVKGDDPLNAHSEYGYVREEYLKERLKRKTFASGTIDLALPDDHKDHAVEAAFEKLEAGNYLLFLSYNENFSTDRNSISFNEFTVSGIRVVGQNLDNQENNIFYAINGKTGIALIAATVELYTRRYNSSSREYVYKLYQTIETNDDGGFRIEKNDRINDFTIMIIYKNDIFVSKNRINYFWSRNQEKNQIESYVFTDRAIYRPGQTVYFKGIVLERNKEKNNNNVIKNYSTTIQFFDVNGQKISDVEVKTNDYGSYSGSFVIPSGLLNGQMRIQDAHGAAYFQVEEYKRPKFEVKILPVKGTYKLNETVKIEGEAMSYSGVAIGNAQLKYRVVRNAHFPIWWMWWRPIPSAPEKEIINGVLKTDDKGCFNISFKTEPDESLSPELKPEFSYTIYADVTDISGETQGTQTSINAGYVSLRAQIQMPEWVSKNEAFNYEIELKNLNGQPVNQEGNVKIEKLKEPEQLFRPKLWEKPDQHIIPEEKYRKLFLHDAYKNEDEIQNFPVEKEYFNIKVSSNNKLSLNDAKPNDLPEGQYKISYSTTDSFGQKVENVKFFKIYNVKGKKAAIKSFAYLIPVKTQNLEPGDKAKFIFGSASNTTVYLKIEHLGNIISDRIIKLKNEQDIIEIPILEEYRGGIFLHLFTVNENRIYKFQERISVPFTNKELDIKTVSFRSKIRPGDAESWKLLIKGKKGEKVASEILAGMYDASLDVFVPHNWFFYLYNENYPKINTDMIMDFSISNAKKLERGWNIYRDFFYRSYDQLNTFGLYFGDYGYGGAVREMANMVIEYDKPMMDAQSTRHYSKIQLNKNEDNFNTDAIKFAPPQLKNGEEKLEEKPKTIQPRKNLQETAFFYPHLRTNENGEVSFEFKTPEALTRWNFMVLAHSQDLKIGKFNETVVTQKELMVQPNPPRFLREGDKISFSAKVSNVSGEPQNGEVYLKLIDPLTLKEIGADFGLKKGNIKQKFELNKGESKAFQWQIKVPDGFEQMQFQVMAETRKFADGEEAVIPILPKRMMVTESLPLPIRGNQTKEFTLEKLLNSKSSSTLKSYNLSLEMTSNPAWYAVLALPYIMEYPYDCAEQTFNRYYGNSLAQHILISNPKIKQMLDAWRGLDSKAFVSNLEKNQELKNILLEESPWVREAKDETERRRRIVQLFEVNQLESSLAGTLTKLEQMQMPEGAWPWFSGMFPDRYITQYIVSGFGHLDKLNVKPEHKNRIRPMLEKAIRYMDEQMQRDYKFLLDRKAKMEENHFSPIHASYLYSRSFYMDIPLQNEHKKAFDYWKEQAQKYWLKTSLINHAMLATALHRLNDKSTPNKILASLTERSLTSEEMGMYWKENNNGYYWYKHPIETQSLLIEAYEEIAKDTKKVEEMKIWLLKQKQTQNWKSTKATADACYALLLRGENLLASDKIVQVYLGGKQALQNHDNSIEKGTGYYRSNWQGNDIKPEMGKVKVVKEDAGIAWGALHWQYYEDLDKITPHQSPLSLKKQVFIEENTPRGSVVKAVTDKNVIKVGDKLKIRIELKVDRNMEYVHLKDMRAAALEPVHALSGYGYKGGLGYYRSIKDASMNFFFAVLPRGSYVFEYDLRASQAGEFLNGIAQVQCMYAPEFGAHSEGVRLEIKN